MFPASRVPQYVKTHVPICSPLPADNSIRLTLGYTPGAKERTPPGPL